MINILYQSYLIYLHNLSHFCSVSFGSMKFVDLVWVFLLCFFVIVGSYLWFSYVVIWLYPVSWYFLCYLVLLLLVCSSVFLFLVPFLSIVGSFYMVIVVIIIRIIIRNIHFLFHLSMSHFFLPLHLCLSLDSIFHLSWLINGRRWYLPFCTCQNLWIQGSSLAVVLTVFVLFVFTCCQLYVLFFW